MEKLTKEKAIERINSSISSIFSKEDVIAIINSIESSSSMFNISISKDDMNDLTDKIVSSLESSYAADVVDFDSAEFCLNGNEISLDGIDLNINYVYSNIRSSIGIFFEEE
jgi:hypothetical protein